MAPMFVDRAGISIADFMIDEAIRNREKQIRGLRKKAERLARTSALQALSVIRQIGYLEELNRKRRGVSTYWANKLQTENAW